MANTGNAQRKTIEDVNLSIHLNGKTLSKFFRLIENKTDFEFTYNHDLIDLSQKLSIGGDKQSLYKLLVSVSQQTDLHFVQINENIHVKLASRKFERAIEIAELADVTITGTVTDINGEPIPGVTILLPGTTTGTATDLDGKYTITVPEASSLSFSFIGFLTENVAIGERSVVDVVLTEDMASLNEVVVIGYGSQKKVNVIGSIATISNEELSSSPVSMVSNALAGRLPGVIVQQQNGEPGNNAANITIRGYATLGNNSPLVVIDGIPGRDLNSLEAGDIESLSVLKDASAAIYGARAANGVILVTTKRGKENTSPLFKYSFNRGLSSPTMLPEMADAVTYAQMIREVQSYKNIPENNMAYSIQDIEKFGSGDYPWTHPNTDWYDAVLTKFTNTNHHTFSVSGGSDNIKYYTSFGKVFDDGIYKNNATSYNRYNLRANVDIQVNEYLSIALDINGSEEDKMYPTKSANSIFNNSLIRSKPTEVATYPNGLPGPDIEYGDQAVVSTSFATGFDDTKKYRSQNMITARLKIPKVEGLEVSGYYAYDMEFQVRKLFQKPWTLHTLDKAAYYANGNSGKEDGSDFLLGYEAGYTEPRVQDYYDDSKTSTYNLKTNYSKTFNGEHNLNTFIAYEGSKYQGKGIDAFRRYFISDKLPYLFAGGNLDQNIGSWVSIDSRINYFGRLSYDFKEKYLFQFSFRRDGSLRFEKENGRWGNFPSVLAGWKVSEESFWKEKLNYIDYLKLKASWGQMGNDRVDAFQYLTNYQFGTGTVFGESKNYASSLMQDGVSNPFITWEVANIFNVGFESLLLNNKMNFEVDYFYQRRDEILVKRNASVPGFTGLGLPDENFGIVDNKGVEIILGYGNEVNDLSYAINGNFSFARNRVIEFDEPARNVPWQVETGHPQGAALLYNSIGIFRNEEHVNSLPHVSGARPGDIIIEDYDGDGDITNDDRILFDRTVNPEITFGLNLSLTYKNWAVRALVQGVGNVQKEIYNVIQGSGGNYFMYDAEGRWTPENNISDKPRAFERDEEYWRGSHKTNYGFHNSSFARLKNLQISYIIPEYINNFARLKSSQIYFSGQNLFLLYSKNKLMDPELGSISNYPLMKVYSLGIEVSF
ncbi:TonB-dependent receptor [Cyclobacterium qasimii M12-11B]|uniref:TonB-dependent receptor n=3 Tax=Cyclobacterium qasimii TaxID=1350429 RepID=S7VPQ0_9BACT|nr:TonB-dependent receptor [Cyclobacterium qasimii M12-11B]GEO20496.1 SusC/RagA family TonB-linked outer membrane protein [Cyclobacterium qasimii]